jgi:hypothetical protein
MSSCKSLINFYFHEFGEWIWIPETKELINRSDIEPEPTTPAPEGQRSKIPDPEEQFKDIEHYLLDIHHIGGAVQYELDAVGWEDIIEDVMVDVIKKYKKKVEEYKPSVDSLIALTDPEKLPAINVLTVWEYTSSQDYWGEYDSDFFMVGFSDINKIPVEAIDK